MNDGLNTNIELKGFSELKALLAREQQNQAEAMVKAQIKVASESVRHLKKALSVSGGRRGQKNARKGGSDPYVTSPKGSLPYKHTGGLMRSIGFKNFANKNYIWTKIGSGVNAPPVEYAKYLEGYNHDGLRPFLQAIDTIVNANRVVAYFEKYYKPLENGK